MQANGSNCTSVIFGHMLQIKSHIFFYEIALRWMLLMDDHFLTWNLVDWQLCCQPIGSHVGKLLWAKTILTIELAMPFLEAEINAYDTSLNNMHGPCDGSSWDANQNHSSNNVVNRDLIIHTRFSDGDKLAELVWIMCGALFADDLMLDEQMHLVF